MMCRPYIDYWIHNKKAVNLNWMGSEKELHIMTQLSLELSGDIGFAKRAS